MGHSVRVSSAAPFSCRVTERTEGEMPDTKAAGGSSLTSVPLKPHKEFIVNEYSNGSMKITWKSRFNISAEPVLYILQRRWNYGIQPSEDQSTHWQTITVTAAHHFIMTDIRPGRWYQFRVAAANMHGTQGFTIPSKHVYTSRDPLPPTAPAGLKRHNLTVAHDGTVSVNITWAVPPEHDLKIHHYRICWKIKNTGKGIQERNVESWVSTNAANTEFTLQGLLGETEYLLKIQAVSYWGQKKMKSPQTQFIFSTAQQGLNPSTMNPALNLSNNQSKLSKSRKNYLQAFCFNDNNQLKIQLYWKQMADNYVEPYTYLIKWKTVVCHNNNTSLGGETAVKGSSYIITGLQFACTYKVTVRPFTLQGPLAEDVTFVKTPKCNNMKVKGLKDSCCPNQERHRLSRSLRHTSEKLKVVFQSTNGKIKGKFHWKIPNDQFLPIESFLFSCAEMSQTHTFYNVLSLPATHNSVIIEDLKPSTFYHILVQIVGLNGSSIEKIFSTPALRL